MTIFQTVNKWLQRIDRSIVFDPASWPYREALCRATAITVIGAFLVVRVYNFSQFPQFLEDARQFYGGFRTAAGFSRYGDVQIGILWGVKLAVWIIETGIFIAYIASYITRVKAVSIARGFMEVAFPIVVAGLPVLMSFLPYRLPSWLPISTGLHLHFFLATMGLMVLGGVINLVGLLTMRQAFTIMSEARLLVTRGIFRYVRHPLYSGHFIAFFGSMLLRMQAEAFLIYLLFLWGQFHRARIEERKLSAAFKDYADYQEQTGMFWPRRFRISHPRQ